MILRQPSGVLSLTSPRALGLHCRIKKDIYSKSLAVQAVRVPEDVLREMNLKRDLEIWDKSFALQGWRRAKVHNEGNKH